MSNKTFELKKGNSILLEGTFNADITNWKIRARFYDECGNTIDLATANVDGGSTDQIQIINIDDETSRFNLQVAEGRTTNFDDDAKLEIHIETDEIVGGLPEKNTPYIADIKFIDVKLK
jgi:hypothetical protein